MYRGDGGRCPACGSALAQLTGTMLPVSGCAACGGLWLGPDAAVHVMQGLGDQVDVELARASATVARTSIVPGPDSGMRACPACGLAMARLAIRDVIVDSCAAHGTWFDRGEVEAVEMACSKLRKQHQRDVEHAGDVTAAGLVEGAGLIVTGSSSLAWGALVNVVEWMAAPRPRYDQYGNRMPGND